MGVEYYIYDTLNKTFYDVGKGAWYKLDVSLFSDYPLLEEWLTKVWVDEGYTDSENIDYMRRVASDIHISFSGTPTQFLGIVSDCGDDICEMKSLGYRCVGTRFYDRGSPDHAHEMDRLNRHLTDPSYGRIYAGMPLSGRY